MTHIRQKLHSRSGASILLALALLLVATMVSAVIISASVTAASRVKDDSVHQQEMLDANSAARFAVKALSGAQFEIDTVLDEWTTQEAVYDGEDPVLDAEGNQVYEPVPHDSTTTTYYLINNDATATALSYPNDPDLQIAIDPAPESISKVLLGKLAKAGGSIPNGTYYFVLSPALSDLPDVNLEFSNAIVTFTLEKKNATTYDIKGTVYSVGSIGGNSLADLEAAIQKSAGAIAITGQLKYEKDGPNSRNSNDHTLTTTTEKWYFNKFKLVAVGGDS